MQSYPDWLFGERLTKADVLSHFRTGADTLDKNAFGMHELWSGDVLVIGGENDPVSSEQDRSETVAHYTNAQLVVIDGAGHTVAIEKPLEFVACARDFISGR